MKINLFSVPISITSKSQALALVGEWVREWQGIKMTNENSSIQHSTFNIQHSTFPKLITTPNPEMIVAAQSDPEFLKVLQSADLAIPDGVGVVWAVRMLNDELRMTNVKKQTGIQHSTFNIIHSTFARLSGLDLMESLIGESAKHGWKVMLLGGKPGVGEKVKRHSEAVYSGRRIPSGSFASLRMTALSGPQNISTISKSDNDRLITSINHVQPDLLFVAFGHGKQEKWLAANRRRLNVGVAMGIGGALDQIADPSLRPPAYINSIGLGWLYRLVRQPWRINRQLALVRFVGMVLGKKFEARNSKLETNSNFQNPNAQNQQF